MASLPPLFLSPFHLKDFNTNQVNCSTTVFILERIGYITALLMLFLLLALTIMSIAICYLG